METSLGISILVKQQVRIPIALDWMDTKVEKPFAQKRHIDQIVRVEFLSMSR